MNLSEARETVAHRADMVRLVEQHEHIVSMWRMRIAEIDQMVSRVEELEKTIASLEAEIASHRTPKVATP